MWFSFNIDIRKSMASKREDYENLLVLLAFNIYALYALGCYEPSNYAGLRLHCETDCDL